jgi:hypothetical protein
MMIERHASFDTPFQTLRQPFAHVIKLETYHQGLLLTLFKLNIQHGNQ